MKIKDNTWVPAECWNTHYGLEVNGEVCSGHMVLVDIEINAGEIKHFEEDGETFHESSPPTLTKIWACNECRVVYKT